MFFIQANEAPSPHYLKDVSGEWATVARMTTHRGATGYCLRLWTASLAEYIRRNCEGPVKVYRVEPDRSS